MEDNLKFCKHCGEKIPSDAVICTKCGRQVEDMGSKSQPLVINNVASSSSSSSSSASSGGLGRKLVSKWIAFCLCLFGGWIGLHKFYEGKIGTGVLYALTGGLCCIGWVIDIFNILGKPDPYEVV